MEISNSFNSKNESVYYKNINKEELDVYSQCAFQVLQQERFEKGMDYHICMIQQEGSTYLFDASMFIEDCIMNQTVIKNPLTRTPITNLSILVSSKKDVDFKLLMSQKEVTTPPNHLPILWNDTRRSLAERIDYLLEYAKFFESQDIEKTLQAYEKAASMGGHEAMLRLVRIYQSMGKNELAMVHLKEALNYHSELAVKDIFYCAHRAEGYSDKETAFRAYQCAAQKKNMIGIGEVILQLEESKSDTSEEVAFWRKQLPSKWQASQMTDFFDHLAEIGYTYDHQGYP